MADRKLGSIAAPSTYKRIKASWGERSKPPRSEPIDDIVRMVASIKAGAVAPSAILRKLAAYIRLNKRWQWWNE
ncbi:transposase [Sphingomonas tagetis]|uniref:transposase n=1 Tax=Sphingomonas tagetis TaxID=2949092 RepID=UPI0020B8C067